jgi:hypothetical protein
VEQVLDWETKNNLSNLGSYSGLPITWT